MGFLSRTHQEPDSITPESGSGSQPYTSPNEKDETKQEVIHQENVAPEEHSKWKVSKTGDGDVAMALFHSPTEIHEPIDPVEEKRLVRKIDFMILPYLAVCYAFFYIDKTTLSYAAIFGIRDDLKLHGTEYNWLSSIFYFGFLVCKYGVVPYVQHH